MPPRSRGSDSALLWRALLKDNKAISRNRSLCTNFRYGLGKPSHLTYPAASTSGPFSFIRERTFSSTPALLKKDKSKKSKSSSDDGPAPATKAGRDAGVDPYDFSELESGIAKALKRLKEALGKTRNAGRVSVEMIEGLGVDLKDGGGKGSQKVKLGDVATVVPKGGRMVQVYAQEEGHIKPLTAAILASPYSLTTSPDTSTTNPNPLVLCIPIPPATGETRAQAAAEARKSHERAMHDIRMARGDAQKRFRKMELGKLVQEDELKKAHKKMEDVVKKGEGDGKAACDAAVKGLER